MLAGLELAPVEARRLVGAAVVEGGGAAIEQRVLGVAAAAGADSGQLSAPIPAEATTRSVMTSTS